MRRVAVGLLIASLGLDSVSNPLAFQQIPPGVAGPPSGSSASSSRRKSDLTRLLASPLNADWNDKNAGTHSRRNLLLTSASAAAAVAAGGTVTSGSLLPTTRRTSRTAGTTAAPPSTIGEAIAWIDENCDRGFLHAVVASGYRFLYRGVEEDATGISVRTEEPDLLSPQTYGSPDALRFFRSLETVLKDDPIRPSNGHLATTSAQDAAAWGRAASIWPAGPDAHYAWFQDGGLFYPRDGDSSSLDRTGIIVDGRDCGKDSLEDALQGDSWEVMVATPSFLAVPLPMEKELRDGLRNSFLV